MNTLKPVVKLFLLHIHRTRLSIGNKYRELKHISRSTYIDREQLNTGGEQLNTNVLIPRRNNPDDQLNEYNVVGHKDHEQLNNNCRQFMAKITDDL